MAISETPDSISFVPSRVDGFDAVSLITVEPERLVLIAGGLEHEFSFAEICQPQESSFRRLMRRVLLRRAGPCMIGERDWFHPPADRFFRFFTEPSITVYMPVDDEREYGASLFCRIQWVWRSVGYETWDLG